ncbi:hypothetical protein ACNSOS_03615 [Aliarcobacter vitoriensis]|uniref:Uncharacterized protein n=1 Tax=Aliarcobacter vitoriensis TaxID=2011099 RepID=A0A366MUC6_9BACT|nr:hypothetical protein [Aliarcobacter vitoriensis]RBQ29002.1 hypothetical protein CRU91_06420 [Aliarcobacter vitoriensis]RBQ31158.1 hypothetical protein CRU92_08280 [Arcobacter sp. FW59]
MSKNKGEPTLEKIDDYNGNESKQKRNTVRLIVILLVLFGAALYYLKQPVLDQAVEIQEKTQIPSK